MKKKNVDPNEFLKFVHDIDISWLPKDKLLREELIKIKEKKYIGSGNYDRDYKLDKGFLSTEEFGKITGVGTCLLYTSPSPRDRG